MSRSIHETRAGYWKEAAFSDSIPARRTKRLSVYAERLRQKKLYKLNEQRRRQSQKAGTPIYVTRHFVRDSQQPCMHTKDGRKIGAIDVSVVSSKKVVA
jgi:hypothetical protein